MYGTRIDSIESFLAAEELEYRVIECATRVIFLLVF